MDEAAFQERLRELVAQIETLAEESKARRADIKKSVSAMQETIDFLRLWIKYMLFDLEATRRENQYLRKMLEEDAGNG
jgi:hypothetical protein